MPGSLASRSCTTVDEPLAAPPLGRRVVRPQALVAAVGGPPAPEVLEPAVGQRERVALEVEEDVARAGRREPRVAARAVRLAGGGGSGSPLSRELHLQRGLVAQELEPLGAQRAAVERRGRRASAATVGMPSATSFAALVARARRRRGSGDRPRPGARGTRPRSRRSRSARPAPGTSRRPAPRPPPRPARRRAGAAPRSAEVDGLEPAVRRGSRGRAATRSGEPRVERELVDDRPA